MASLALAVPVMAAACGSSSGGSASGHAPAAVCQQTLAVLSDGPDPGADPVGYALSQIAPLGRIHTSDHAVATTISQLIAADRALVASKGDDHPASKAITRADASLNTVCPGTAP
jgi:hypothetical protein